VPPDTVSGLANPRLRLMRQLTAAAQSWGVWKGADANGGDLDSIAVRDEWPAVEAAFLAWAQAERLDSVVVCTHAPGMLLLAGLGGVDPRRLHQLDVVAHKQLHGALLFRADDLRPLLELDPTGMYRRLRRGSEGLLRLALDAGDDDARELVERDPAGARLVAAEAGLLGRAVLRARDGRGRGLVLASALARAAASPRLLGEALLFDLRWRWRCPVLRALRADRTAPEDLGDWLTRVSAAHLVHDLA